MALSKPIINIVSSYLHNLYAYPIRTKAITSCIIAASANYTSQCIGGVQKINGDSILAFGLFGLLFGGSFPHFFYMFLEKCLPAEGVSCGLTRQLLVERLFYTPFYQMFSLYTTSRLEGKDHKTALNTMLNLIKPVVLANWKYLTILQIINFAFVPPMLRVLFVNVMGFFWSMHLAKMRRNEANNPKKNP